MYLSYVLLIMRGCIVNNTRLSRTFFIRGEFQKWRRQNCAGEISELRWRGLEFR
jgi:hypothetical protein